MNPLQEGPLKGRNQQRKAPDYTAMKILKELILSQHGWIIRQALKAAAAGGTAVTTWLVSHSVNVDGQAIGAALSTLAVGLAEVALSRFSDNAKSEAIK